MTIARGLSKSRLVSSLQCQRRLWLATYRPDLEERSADTERVYGIGHEIGELARQLYGPGPLVEVQDGRFSPALAETQSLLQRDDGQPVFEATFQHDGLLVRLDVLRRKGQDLELIEVKSSTSVKDHQIADAAIQAWVMERAGFAPKRVAIAVVDSSFVYQGNGDYRGLLHEENVTHLTKPVGAEVEGWIADARATLAGPEPVRDIGAHCSAPYDCPFRTHCEGERPKYPVTMLPHGGRKVWSLREEGYKDLTQVPEDKLRNPKHLRVWRTSRSGTAEVDIELRRMLSRLPYPRYYMDFETLWLAIPHWPGTKPYEQVPYQWSVHREDVPGEIAHAEFLAEGDVLPVRAFVESLLRSLGSEGPILVYADFEAKILKSVQRRFPDLKHEIDAVLERIVDLLPLMRKHYYHPDMQGSWSIKAVLPTVCPELSYADVGLVQDGGAALEAFAETLKPECAADRRAELRKALLDYCRLDTMAMVKVVGALS